jgi:hypothetical protein
MSNTWGVFEEWKNGLLGVADKAGDKLLGSKQSVQPGQDTMRRGDGLIDQGLNYAGGKIDQAQEAGAQYFQGEKVFDPATGGPTKRTGVQSSESMKDLDIGIKKFDQGINKTKDYLDNQLEKYFPNFAGNNSISNKEKTALIEGATKGNVDPKLLEAVKNKTDPINQKDIPTLEKVMGISFDDAKANWKDKGGMDGLMSNPAFSLGLALMQSSANGKTINQGVLDNFMKAAKISEHYQDRIKAKTQVFGPPSQDERDFAQAALTTIGMTGPGKWSKGWDFVKLWGKDNQAAYNRGLNTIVVQAKKEIDKKYKGKSHTVTEQDYIDAFNTLKSQGKIKDMKTLFGVTVENTNKNKSLTSKGYDWLKKKVGAESEFYKAEGGPVSAGKPYMVGEKGPEIIIPRSDGDVLTNDDSQIYAMLLASNPQLQKVSKARAEKIMRNRFPEYFEG